LPIDASIQSALDKLAANQANLYPTTVLFAEIPSNPDQKIPDIAKLAASLNAYRAQTGKEVLLFVDTTFAPASQVLGKLEAIDPTLQAMVFVSMSKSVSRGTTTAGALVANHTAGSCALVNASRETASLLDTHVRKDQLYRLCMNHTGVEARCQSAYEVTLAMGKALTSAVATYSGAGGMELTYVHPDHAALGFTSSTFSFNLPAPTGAGEATKAALAQRFVDLLTEDAERFKPCVSFGQDNGLVYCTVPATSTQGAIKVEDKAKQAKGGVQLARLSFPPTVDLTAVQARIEMACAAIYGKAP
jgi:cysteine synthase A